MSRVIIYPATIKGVKPIPRYDVTVSNNRGIEGGSRTNVINLVSMLIAREEFETITINIRRNK